MDNEAVKSLADEEKLAHSPSGVLTDGEALFYDTSKTTPINKTYPDPAEFINVSGIYATYAKSDSSYPVGSNLGVGSMVSEFSNGLASIADLINAGITDFSIFNPYIHYYGVEQPTGTVVAYSSTPSAALTSDENPVKIGYGFGVLSPGYYSLYPTGDGGTYLRTSRESWNVDTSGYGPPVQPNWPPLSGNDSGEVG